MIPSVTIPARILLDPNLTGAAKLVLIAREAMGGAQAETVSLRQAAGLSKSSVLRIAKSHTSSPAAAATLQEPRVRFPLLLLTQAGLGIQARLLYGLLQMTDGFAHPKGTCRLSTLHRLSGVAVSTLRRALRDLAAAGWVSCTQKDQNKDLAFELLDPVEERGKREVALAQHRLLFKDCSRGEALMREYLSLLIPCPHFEDGARPGFLVNPNTGERLEFDRYYWKLRLAFEYNGRQHYEECDLADADQVAYQRMCDLVKAGHCVEQGIALVVIHARDLSLRRMQAKLRTLVQMRETTLHRQLVTYLEGESRSYRRNPKAHARPWKAIHSEKSGPRRTGSQ